MNNSGFPHGSNPAHYAMTPEHSRGRKHPENEHPYRSMFQRDRDRIIHSTAFRRLQYKTQVFVNHEGDHYRTRLTHTLEVVQIARTIAKALRLNDELVEAIALAHDIGHTPFGHAGEEALHELMREHGGFEHNLQGLKVVDQLEERYQKFPGLNLTWEVREGIAKHDTIYDKPVMTEFEPDKFSTLEAQVVDIADEIAYSNHDLDDGIASGLLSRRDLEGITLWKQAREKTLQDNIDPQHEKYHIIRTLIDMQVSDLIAQTHKRIGEFGITSPQSAREQKEKIVTVSKQMRRDMRELQEYLFKNLYRHYKVVRMSSKARRFLIELFRVYLENPDQLPPAAKCRLKEEDSRRVICDYIAGMTDRYALDEYKKLFHPWEKV